MYGLKVNRFSRQLQLVFLLMLIAAAVWVSIALGDDHQAAGQTYGQTGTATVATTATAPAGAASTPTTPAAPPDAGQATPPNPPKPDVSKPSYNNPDSIIQLLKDSKAATDALGQAGAGASFHETDSMSIDGAMFYIRADGHVVPHGNMSISAELDTPGKEVTRNGQKYLIPPDRLSIEGRFISESIYIRLGSMEEWLKANLSDFTDMDEDWNDIDFTQFVINPEFLGQETTKQGYPVYHVRIGIDAAKVAEEAQKHVKDKICDKTKEEIDKLATSTITDELWIGVNDKLVYQATEKFLNTDLMISYDNMMEFYNWGEKVDIQPPAPDKVIDLSGYIHDSSSNDSCPA